MKPRGRTKKTSRTKDQKKRDRAIIADMYLKGYNQFDIGDEVGISQPQVAYDLKVIRKLWVESTLRDFDEAKAKELTKLDKLEQEAWEAWERSKIDKETKSQEFVKKLKDEKDKKSQEDKPKVAKINLKKEGQTGNPAYLAIVKDCIKRRCDILGLDAPKKAEHTGKDGGPLNFAYNPVFKPVKAEEK